MLTHAELQRAAAVLSARVGARVQNVLCNGAADLVLRLQGGASAADGADELKLLLNFDGRQARAAALHQFKRAPLSAFAKIVQARLRGARLQQARVSQTERQLWLRFGEAALLLSLLGARSNLYLLNAERRIEAAAKPLQKTRPELQLQKPWQNPPVRPHANSTGADAPSRFAGVPDAEFLFAVETRAAAVAEQNALAQLRGRLQRALRKQKAAAARKINALEKDLQGESEAARLESQGEILKAHLQKVRAGQRELQAPSFEGGAPVTVPLDAALSPRGNLQNIFRQARRAKKRARQAQQELPAARERAQEAAAALACAENADAKALKELAARPEIARLLLRRAPPRNAAAESDSPAADSPAAAAPRKVWKLGKQVLPARLAPKRYRTEAGLEIWVGKSDAGNDLLTTRLARGRDLFFHLEGNPGSHVVLRLESAAAAAAPPQEALLDACALAVHFSKARGATRARVHCAKVKDISKPADAKPGLVYVHRGRTYELRAPQARTERVLSARID